MTKQPPLSKKDRRKRVRSVLQGAVLLVFAVVIFRAFVSFDRYEPYVHALTGTDNGFVTVSYFGTDRNKNDNLISQKLLGEHLAALKASGYVTITQQDVLDYYAGKKNLPEKALFLLFEDGRRNTSIFAQDHLKKNNFIATMFSYAGTLQSRDPHFLSPKELKSMQKNSYWEMGTNGYRLSFINVFDRYDSFLGELNSLKFSMVAPYLERRYDHYLMDYIRDENGMPTESFEQMQQRLNADYTLMQEIYEQSLGVLPRAYSLMHSNTGQFGTNDRASRVNAENIGRLFALNINREGYAHNDKSNSVYDLTRIQPQNYWSVNHLLMRIQADSGQSVAFETGDAAKAAAWTRSSGQAEFSAQTITLTSPPNAAGQLRLVDTVNFQNGSVSAKLLGNAFGAQSILLRADDAAESFLKVSLADKTLRITERIDGQEQELYAKSLDAIAGITPRSVEEDQLKTQIAALEMRIRYADDAGEAAALTKRLAALQGEKSKTVQDGAKEFTPNLALDAPQEKQLDITLQGDQLSVSVDGTPAAQVSVQKAAGGGVIVEAAASKADGFSQRNLKDDVYDGIFEDLFIADASGAAVFDARLHGREAALFNMRQTWDALVGWFVDKL